MTHETRHIGETYDFEGRKWARIGSGKVIVSELTLAQLQRDLEAEREHRLRETARADRERTLRLAVEGERGGLVARLASKVAEAHEILKVGDVAYEVGRIDTLRGIFLGAYFTRAERNLGSYLTTMLRWIESKALQALAELGQEDARRIIAEREEYEHG